MDKERLNFLFQLLSVGAVIAGLIFVAVEISQNNEMMRTQIRNEMTLAQIENTRFRQTPEMLALAVKARDTNYGFTPEEEMLWDLWIRSTARMWENMHYQQRLGLYDLDEAVANRAIWTVAFTQDEYFRNFWQQSKGDFSASFQQEIDSVILREN